MTWTDEDMKRARAALLEEVAQMCETMVRRPAGYGGNWEGYGSFMDDKTGPECAAEIRLLIDIQPTGSKQ